MDMAIDQARDDEAARQIDAARGARLRVQTIMGTHGDDPLAIDQNVLVGPRRAAGAVDDRDIGIENRFSRMDRRRDDQRCRQTEKAKDAERGRWTSAVSDHAKWLAASFRLRNRRT
jgi:hypothetical protein